MKSQSQFILFPTIEQNPQIDFSVMNTVRIDCYLGRKQYYFSDVYIYL